MNIKHNIVLYLATNQTNGNKYIGITCRGLSKREAVHRSTAKCGRGAIFGAAIRKYGNSIKFSELAVCPDHAYAKALEVAAIAAYSPEYNITKGGDGCVGYKHSPEHKSRVGHLMRGNRFWEGKKHSPDTIQKMKRSAGRHRRRAITCLSDGISYDSQRLAAAAYDITPAYVCLLCKTGGSMANGRQFVYSGDYVKSIWGGAQSAPVL